MHKLIILRGNSGSGKTTIAKELREKLGNNTMLISQDVIRREILKVRDGENNPALPLIQELLIYGSKHCEVIILEGILHAQWYKPLFELALELYGADVHAYYFDIPFEETVRRHQTRPNCNDFSEEDMRSWWLEKDFSSVLNEISITADMEKEDIVNWIMLSVHEKGELDDRR